MQTWGHLLHSNVVIMFHFSFNVHDSHVVKPVLRGHLWDKEKVVLR